MYTLQMKKWFHLAHLPDRHRLITWAEDAVHDERFWPIVIASSLIVILIAFFVWAGLSGDFNVDNVPPRPFPYGY
jgi:hypothetical protein